MSESLNTQYVLLVNTVVSKKWAIGIPLSDIIKEYEIAAEYYAQRYGTGIHEIAIDRSKFETVKKYTASMKKDECHEL